MGGEYSILCIDDEDNILQSLNRLLRKEGYKMFLATGGEEGLKMLRNEKIDLILCDQKMPEMSGFEVLRVAREEKPEVMRIMLSGYSDFESLVKTINEGEVYRYISKPWDQESLITTIASALEQKKMISEIHNLSQRLKDIGEIVKKIKIKQNQDQSAIMVDISLHDKAMNSEHVSVVITHLFKLLGLEESESVGVDNSCILKDKNFIKFEVTVKKGVKLIININVDE